MLHALPINLAIDADREQVRPPHALNTLLAEEVFHWHLVLADILHSHLEPLGLKQSIELQQTLEILLLHHALP